MECSTSQGPNTQSILNGTTQHFVKRKYFKSVGYAEASDILWLSYFPPEMKFDAKLNDFISINPPKIHNRIQFVIVAVHIESDGILIQITIT